MGELLRFATVGAAGYFVDVAALYFAKDVLGLGYYGGRVVSYLVAATFTWYLNARFTFRSEELGVRQWGRFLAANSAGAVVKSPGELVGAVRRPRPKASKLRATPPTTSGAAKFFFWGVALAATRGSTGS